MKTSCVAILLGFAALVSGASLQKGIQPRLNLNLNSALDTVFTKIRNNATGFDPFSLPDVEKSFNWKVYSDSRLERVETHFGKTTPSTPDRDSNFDFPVIDSLVFSESDALDHAATENHLVDNTRYQDVAKSIVKTRLLLVVDEAGHIAALELNHTVVTLLQLVIKGDLDLTNGQLRGLSTISRTGDATADLEGSEADVIVKLAFDDFKFQYDFSATIDDLGPSGLAHGEITEFYINAEVLANLSDTTAVKISLKSLEFEHAGIEVSAAGLAIGDSSHARPIRERKITLDLDGKNEILNDINDALTGVITSILKDQVLSLLQNVVKSVLDDTLKDLTFNLNDLL
ncbi:unnamed protein product [Timema podura]|uniref:Uncharacterized protein n=1 Tax=Timema podura TaxID=61482 RepID=A0ABN7P1P1_TIMPD|nr:unnamed protein product [Timema podura]